MAVAIARATRADIDGILALQEANLPERGGLLSARLPRTWFEAALEDMPMIVARREVAVVGYLVSASRSAVAGVPVIAAMLRAYAGTADAYVYGPVCVAVTERGRGWRARWLWRCVRWCRDVRGFCSSGPTMLRRCGRMLGWGCGGRRSLIMTGARLLRWRMSGDCRGGI